MNDDFQDELSARLHRECPVPRPAYRGDLRRRLLSLSQAGFGRPPRLRMLVAAYASSGAALLAVAVIGALGVGPLATG
jgi:hypothetical protein